MHSASVNRVLYIREPSWGWKQRKGTYASKQASMANSLSSVASDLLCRQKNFKHAASCAHPAPLPDLSLLIGLLEGIWAKWSYVLGGLRPKPNR